MPEKQLPIDIPDEIWDQIISLLPHDRFLQPLSLVSKRFYSITNRFKKTLIISNPTLLFLPNLLSRFPNLRHFIFSDFHSPPGPVFDRIALSPFPIETLDLSNFRNFPFEHIQRLPSSSLASIRCLKLSGLSVISDFDLGVIADVMGNVEEIDLSDPREDYDDMEGSLNGGAGITDEGVGVLASKVGKLRRINLSGNYMISDKSVVCLADKCKDLEEIVLKNCTFVTQFGVSYLMCNAINLNCLALLGMDLVAQEICDSFVSARNLSVLEFSYMSVSDGLLFAIAKANLALRKFTLYHCKDFKFSGILSLLFTYQSLEYFALEGVYWLNDRSIIDIAKLLSKVNTVKFNFCSRLTSSGFFTLLKNCPLLTCLEMEKTDLGKEEFAVNNSTNVNVRALTLSSNKTLDNECLEKIASSCPNLELLDVSECPGISRKGIGEIVRRCRSLRHLLINGCGAIKTLGIDTKLRKLETLRASVSGLNDEGLITIARKCPSLMYLDVMGCAGVNARGVKEVVKHCERLKEINLNWCRDMGHDIVAWMVFSRPSLRKIVPPYGWVMKDAERDLFLRHGCYVCES